MDGKSEFHSSLRFGTLNRCGCFHLFAWLRSAKRRHSRLTNALSFPCSTHDQFYFCENCVAAAAVILAGISELRLLSATRTLLIVVIFGGTLALAGRASVPPIEIPVTISQGTSVRVPFSVTQSGTYDLELQYRAGVEMYYNRILDRKVVEELAGTVTLSCDGTTLKRNLPTRWGRGNPGRVTTVLVRFRAQTQKTYVCSLRITHLPVGVPHNALLVVRCVTPHFHPGHRVYELE